MAINPKLEFFRFSLNHESDDFKTFKNYAVETLGSKATDSESKIMNTLLKHFLTSLDEGVGKDETDKKQITLVKKKEVNKFLNFTPKIKASSNVIHGVINGGNYGRMRILTKIDSNDDSSELDGTNSVLQYFYFYLYLPLDHNEGSFIIQSNGNSESITKLFRKFVTSIFKKDNYLLPSSESFCPKAFQKEFKEGATLKSMTFKETFIDNVPTTSGTTDILSNFDIIIKAVPKNKDVSIREAENFLKKLSNFTFGKNGNKAKIQEFSTAKFEAKNSVNKSVKTFEWNTRDSEFTPVVYLKDRIQKFNYDGTADFNELIELCHNLFTDEVLPEIRPDLYVSRVK